MKLIQQLFLIILLILFALSIETPFGSNGEPYFHPVTTEPDHQFNCLASSIPPNEIVLFTTETDGAIDWSTSTEMLTRTQYHLVPILIAAHIKPGFDIEKYRWVVTASMTLEEIEAFSKRNNLQIVQYCPGMAILTKVIAE